MRVPELAASWPRDVARRARSRNSCARGSSSAMRSAAAALSSPAPTSPTTAAAPALFAAVVVLDAQRLAVVEIASTTARARFPYVPGYLSFRELPPLLDAFAKLRTARTS